MPNISIRPATRNDAADLAILDNLAGHGIPIIFWQEVSGSTRIEDILVSGREYLADDDKFYNWKKARIALEGDRVVGSSISYIMPEPDEESESIKQNNKPFKPIFELYDECTNHWFIDALAVYPSAQGKGVGKLLFDDSIDLGKAAGAKVMSLIVEDTNEVAYALYRSYGFEVVNQREFVSFESAREINEWLLMSRALS